MKVGYPFNVLLLFFASKSDEMPRDSRQAHSGHYMYCSGRSVLYAESYVMTLKELQVSSWSG